MIKVYEVSGKYTMLHCPKKRGEIFEIFEKYFTKYFVKYFTPKNFMKFYMSLYHHFVFT